MQNYILKFDDQFSQILRGKLQQLFYLAYKVKFDANNYGHKKKSNKQQTQSESKR